MQRHLDKRINKERQNIERFKSRLVKEQLKDGLSSSNQTTSSPTKQNLKSGDNTTNEQSYDLIKSKSGASASKVDSYEKQRT